MKIIVKKDGNGFMARVAGQPDLFAWAPTREEVLKELAGVIEMMMDLHLEKLEIERHAREALATGKITYAV